MSPSVGASLPELVVIAFAALPSVLVPLAILYWGFGAGRRCALETADRSQHLEHDASPNG